MRSTLRIVALVVLASFVACTTHNTATIVMLRPNAIRVPLADPSAQTCAQACTNTNDFAACLSGCPGRSFAPGACPAVPDPNVACASVLMRAKEVRDGTCAMQTVNPGDQVIRCREDSDSSMDPALKLALWIGGGLLAVGYFVAITHGL